VTDHHAPTKVVVIVGGYSGTVAADFEAVPRNRV
jgi:hypothetical protein